jgi:Trypsin
MRSNASLFATLGCACVLTLFALPSEAILIRDDIKEDRYAASAADIPFLVDLNPEGHGVLIAPQWVLTAAHATLGADPLKGVTIKGQLRAVEKVILHSGFRTMPPDMNEWDLDKLKTFMLENHDIALIKLKEPITDIEPARLYRRNTERGKPFAMYGKGRFGTGAKGQIDGSNAERSLRVANNRVDGLDSRWLRYTFDNDRDALPIEGFQASGDSGAPLFMQRDRSLELVGLISWRWNGTRDFTGPAYNSVAYSVRVSQYIDWIESEMKR